jgi:hypothetical protein
MGRLVEDGADFLCQRSGAFAGSHAQMRPFPAMTAGRRGPKSWSLRPSRCGPILKILNIRVRITHGHMTGCGIFFIMPIPRARFIGMQGEGGTVAGPAMVLQSMSS